MEPAGAALSGLAAAGTSALFLAGNEQQYFSELFSLCGGGQSIPEVGPGLGTPAVGGSKVAELFRASQLPAEMLHQVPKKPRAVRKSVGFRSQEEMRVFCPHTECFYLGRDHLEQLWGEDFGIEGVPSPDWKSYSWGNCWFASFLPLN